MFFAIGYKTEFVYFCRGW